jgi:hypothetical protein
MDRWIWIGGYRIMDIVEWIGSSGICKSLVYYLKTLNSIDK